MFRKDKIWPYIVLRGGWYWLARSYDCWLITLCRVICQEGRRCDGDNVCGGEPRGSGCRYTYVSMLCITATHDVSVRSRWNSTSILRETVLVVRRWNTYASPLGLDLMMRSDSASDRWMGSEVPGLTSGWFSLNLAYNSMSSFLELRLHIQRMSFSIRARRQRQSLLADATPQALIGRRWACVPLAKHDWQDKRCWSLSGRGTSTAWDGVNVNNGMDTRVIVLYDLVSVVEE